MKKLLLLTIISAIFMTGKAEQVPGAADFTIEKQFVLADNKASTGTLFSAEEKEHRFYVMDRNISQMFGKTPYYDGATISFYKEGFEKDFEFNISVPETTNQITFRAEYSKNFFNEDNKREFLIYIHYFEGGISPDNQKNEIRLYNEDGELLHTFADVTHLEIFNDLAEGKRIITSYNDASTRKDITELYTADNLSEPIHRNEVDNRKLMGVKGSTLYCPSFDNKDYYSFAYLKEDFYKDGSTSEIRMSNTFVLDIYDFLNGTLYKTLEFPFTFSGSTSTPSVGFGEFGEFSLTKNVFNEDDKLAIIYGIEGQYMMKTEDGKIISKENLQGEIGAIKPLSDIANTESQFQLSTAEGEKIVALPSFKHVTTLPQGGNFVRALYKGKPAYAGFQGKSISINGREYGAIDWFDESGNIFEEVRLELGASGTVVYYQPVLTSKALNPHTINGDDKMEYLGFRRDDIGNTKTTGFMTIHNEDGKMIFEATADEEFGEIIGGGLYNFADLDTDQAEYIQISYQKTEDNKSTNTYNFYSLPLFKFMEGDGTKENPYLITSATEFDWIRNDPNAHYILGNDIDMAPYLSEKYPKGWVGIEQFRGSLNGNGYAIKNFGYSKSATDSWFYALFADLVGGTIENLTLEDINIDLGGGPSGNRSIAPLADMLSGSAIVRNCHVTGNISYSGSKNLKVGGVVGGLSAGCTVSQCSFNGDITLSSAGNVGGIAYAANGNNISSASILACTSKGNITINNTANSNGAGGIVGSTQSNAVIKDCYSAMNITTSATGIGGIVGTVTSSYPNKARISNCYASGNMVAKLPISGNGSAGGIIGSSSYSYSGTKPEEAIFTSLVALNEIVQAEKAPFRIAGLASMTIAMYDPEYDGPDMYGMTNDKFSQCYALNTMQVGASNNLNPVSTGEIDNLDGKNVTKEELTKAFFEGLGWKFGSDLENPWVWIENSYPQLWYEIKVTEISLNETAKTIAVDETLQLTATILPKEAVNKNVIWTSSDTSVAEVDDNGLVKALSAGNTTITATTEDGGLTATCEITVTVPVTGISLNKQETSMYVGDTEQLVATIMPENATNKNVTWLSDKTDIVTVSEDGLITGISEGKAVVSVTTEDGSFTASCAVTILPPSSINNNAINSVNLYPNPVVNTLNISSDKEIKKVSIYNTSGTLIEQKSGVINTITMDHYAPGMYIIQVQTESGNTLHEIIKK